MWVSVVPYPHAQATTVYTELLYQHSLGNSVRHIGSSSSLPDYQKFIPDYLYCTHSTYQYTS